jgi:oligopeptide transport system permease protein
LTLRLPIVVLASLLVLAAVCFVAWPHPPDQPYWDRAFWAPFQDGRHPFGTDAIGRDLLIRVLLGTALSIVVGLGAGLLAALLGVVVGAWAGFKGGIVDEALMRLVDVLMALPLLLFAILLLAFFEPNMVVLMLLVGLFGALDVARTMRIEARRIASMDFVLAARLQGYGTAHIVRRHVLPNLWPALLTAIGVIVPQAILVESFLAFLGLAPSERIGSLGSLLAEGVQDMAYAPWTLLLPALAMATVLLCFGLIGDGLRDARRADRGEEA